MYSCLVMHELELSTFLSRFFPSEDEPLWLRFIKPGNLRQQLTGELVRLLTTLGHPVRYHRLRREKLIRRKINFSNPIQGLSPYDYSNCLRS